MALWALAERGLFSFSDKIADHVPAFAKNAKGNITVLQTITHQAGFPTAVVGKDAWADHKRLREVVCDFPLEWSPGSKVHYHGLTAHWTLGVLIEAVTGKDFRDVIRETVAEPLGLGRELYVGLPEAEFGRAADMHEPLPKGDGMRRDADANSAEWRKGGAPGGAGYGTARAMAALYQMMLSGGELNGTRIVGPRTLQYALRNHTGDRLDEFMGMPMHRGLGPHLRGTTENIRGLGALANPRVFGHGGVGTSYCWGDPEFGRVVRLRHQQPHPRSLAQQATRPRRQPRALGDPLAAEALARAGLRPERGRRQRERRDGQDHHGGVAVGPVVQQTAEPGAQEAAQAHADADQAVDAAEMGAAVTQRGERRDHRTARAHAAAEQQHVEPQPEIVAGATHQGERADTQDRAGIGEDRRQPSAAAIGEPAEADHAERREEARDGQRPRGVGAVQATLQQIDHRLGHERKDPDRGQGERERKRPERPFAHRLADGRSGPGGGARRYEAGSAALDAPPRQHEQQRDERRALAMAKTM